MERLGSGGGDEEIELEPSGSGIYESADESLSRSTSARSVSGEQSRRPTVARARVPVDMPWPCTAILSCGCRCGLAADAELSRPPLWPRLRCVLTAHAGRSLC